MSLTSRDLIPLSFDYDGYVRENKIDILLGEASTPADCSKKTIKSPTFSVDISNNTPFPAEYDDLARLHYIVSQRKSLTVLEFGVGKSTLVIGDALLNNKRSNADYTSTALRRKDAYQIHSVENHLNYMQIVDSQIPLILREEGICNLHHSELEVGTFLDKVCTYYSKIPNVCPDVIYLDGPDQFSPSGDVKGITTSHQDRMSMAADILLLEHFLQPSTLIIVDGRTANARFLQCNLQRSWSHCYNEEWDQHFFELQETPLGVYNKRMIDFCLGENFYNRI